MLNVPSGHGGFALKNGCSINNLTVRFTRKHASGTNPYFTTIQTTTYANVSLTNIHVVVSGTAEFYGVSSDSFAISCTINNIVLEGTIAGVFSGTISCLIEHIKVYRNYVYNGGVTYSGIVGTLNAEMRYCQHIIPTVTATAAQNRSYLVNTMSTGAIIKECFVVANVLVTYSADANVTHGMIYSATGTQGTHTIQDSYFKGNFSVNRGEITSDVVINTGKSGYTFSTVKKLKTKRCFSFGNVNTPLNNNRTVLVREYDTVNNHVENCFYNRTKIVDITPLDIVGQQTGLTTSEFINSTNFTGWDFSNVWVMGADTPVLRNNPFYTFELDPRLVTITSTTRNSASQITIVLNPVWEFDIYGLEISTGGEIIYDVTNTLSNVVTVDNQNDHLYTVKLYWLDGGIKTIVSTTTYQHYSQDTAINTTTVAITQKVSLAGAIDANSVHGSCLLGDYVYGSTRNKTFPTQPGSIVKASLSDITNFNIIPIYTDSEGVGISYEIDQIVVCGNFLYAVCSRNTGGSILNSYLVQFNPSTNDYKIFLIGLYTSAPILTDGTYLYISVGKETWKVSPNDFIGSYPKFNTSSIFSFTKIATYNHDSQGGHILGGYSSDGKGTVHSVCADSSYIYLSFTTANVGLTDVNGYAVSLNQTLFEVHKVNKSTMLADSWTYIPKSTDDMCQNSTHLFYGIEVGTGANTNTYGYGWGAYAVRKSDLRLTALPRLHSIDNPPVTQSYGSLMFGNYLLDTRTNRYTSILDVSDVDNWLVTEPAGKRTIKFYQYTYENVTLDLIPNEFLLSDAGSFYAFLWSNPSGLMKVSLPDLNFFAIPTVETLSAVVNNKSATLTGYILNTGGYIVTSRGFRYGSASNNLSEEVLSSDTTFEFTFLLQNLSNGTYYYRAFAVNSLGENIGEIGSFIIKGGIYLGTQEVKKIYLGSTLINRA